MSRRHQEGAGSISSDDRSKNVGTEHWAESAAEVHGRLAVLPIQPDIQWGRSELGAGEVVDT